MLSRSPFVVSFSSGPVVHLGTKSIVAPGPDGKRVNRTQGKDYVWGKKKNFHAIVTYCNCFCFFTVTDMHGFATSEYLWCSYKMRGSRI